MNVDDLARLMGMREAAASVALDGETMHVAAPDGSCCWKHAMERIAELEADNRRLRKVEAEAKDTLTILLSLQGSSLIQKLEICISDLFQALETADAE